MKKILWLASYPYTLFTNNLNISVHPAPWITELAHAIKGKTHLTIASHSPHLGNDFEEFERGNIRFIFVKAPKLNINLLTFYMLRIRRLYRYLANIKHEFDLIHVHGTEHQYEYVAQKLCLPYIVSIQGLISLCKDYFPQKISRDYIGWHIISEFEKIGLKRAKYFSCRTHWDSAFVKRLNPKAKIFFNWELLRKEFFHDSFNQESDNLLFMGGTNRFKGIREALLAMDLLKSKGYSFKLQICGHGCWEQLAPFIRKNGFNIHRNDIIFFGPLDAKQLADAFAKTFCLIHPSYMDNSPNSICEAQVAGLPVVASNVGGVKSLIENGQTGLLVDRYDHTELANQVINLKENPKIYQYISHNSRLVARQRHQKKTIVERTINAYSQVLSG